MYDSVVKFDIKSGTPESVEWPGLRERFSATAFKVDPPLPSNLRLKAVEATH